uniref:DDE-1 domain-containing protein n=1 Tax=Amphimedon queenslandica TaxID=400682 RepID=A0A1X7VA23_AMPQE
MKFQEHFMDSPKGWMDKEFFFLWFMKHFLQYAVIARPLISLLDGHFSLFSKTIRLAREHDVTLFTFPPNTTHLTQPLDEGIFGPLKIQWWEECHKYQQENSDKIINRFSFGGIFSKAWMKFMTTLNIVHAFETVGVYPFN